MLASHHIYKRINKHWKYQNNKKKHPFVIHTLHSCHGWPIFRGSKSSLALVYNFHFNLSGLNSIFTIHLYKTEITCTFYFFYSTNFVFSFFSFLLISIFFCWIRLPYIRWINPSSSFFCFLSLLRSRRKAYHTLKIKKDFLLALHFIFVAPIGEEWLSSKILYT